MIKCLKDKSCQELLISKVRCLYQCSKMQFITFQNFHIQTWFSQFLWFFSLKCWFKGQMISRIHLILPNAYKLMCFDRNINGNRDVKFLECDKWSLHWYKNLTLKQHWFWLFRCVLSSFFILGSLLTIVSQFSDNWYL